MAWLPVYHSAMTDPPPVREEWAQRTARGTAPGREAYRCPDRECVFVSASLAVMVAHVRAHREPDREAPELSQARIEAGAWRIRASLARLPDQEYWPPPVVPGQSLPPCACGCGAPVTRPRAAYASEVCRLRAMRARKRARRTREPEPVPAVAAHAGLASAAGTVPQAAAGQLCADGCGLVFAQARGHGNRKKFATLACAKRQQRRAERAELARYRELAVAAALPWPPAPPASSTAVTGSARCLSSVR